MKKTAPDIMVALSGGVDSATTAWLLRQQGHAIAGMFMKNWEEDDPDSGCSAEADAADARAVCALLDIPFHGRNFSAEYWEGVFEHFLAELAAGRTPNPDVLCNREIKFKAFVEHALDLGATEIATGHYARRRDNADGSVSLLKGRDAGKDQSYFLYALTQEQLARARFPLGELEKSEVRRLAEKAALPVARKKDSTGICFIGERRFDDFIDRYLRSEPGPIRSEDGTRIGQHSGLIHYTLGQRKGLDIGGLSDFPEGAWYVAAKDLTANALCAVQASEHRLLMSDELTAGQLTWIDGKAPAAGTRLTAKVRYRQPDQACIIKRCTGSKLQLRFARPQRAVTPGQSVVLYDGDHCLGGGVIEHCNAPRPDWMPSPSFPHAVES
ncbi:tRNA 2-thiouridine(34) synthase MnmA [Wenzhouxiangella limi]|uniref:tRNA-specific 2-thiouridylase MnmA n=1 Tax=Wenzhouxiangella limi TaxID=2707351 RepID=A0A845UVJ1_9GAMM|nr:tRNA 2-thiouridine(34) synthase MnmA [Wenzhouxiangella limi]NDY94598.1 tRNA 2-thiouridine(34) synthase MnmA [Wenzhouxiangella limi]